MFGARSQFTACGEIDRPISALRFPSSFWRRVSGDGEFIRRRLRARTLGRPLSVGVGLVGLPGPLPHSHSPFLARNIGARLGRGVPKDYAPAYVGMDSGNLARQGSQYKSAARPCLGARVPAVSDWPVGCDITTLRRCFPRYLKISPPPNGRDVAPKPRRDPRRDRWKMRKENAQVTGR